MSFVITFITQDYRGYPANKTERGWETWICDGSSTDNCAFATRYEDINLVHDMCNAYNSRIPGHIVEEFQ